MPRGCLRERNGHFYVRVRVLVVDAKTGDSRLKQTEKAAGTSRRKAERLLRNLQDAAEDGRFVPTNMTVLELGHKWLTEHVEPNLKPGAVANYRGTFYTHVAPALGTMRIEDCGSQMIRALLGRKRAEGLSAATVAKLRRHLHAMFAFAQDAGLVIVNPADAARARGRKPGRCRARGTELSPMQVKLFLDECSPRWRLFFTVALDTGLRRGELIGLRWGDIDLLERIISVRRSIGPYDRPEQLPGAGRAQHLATKTESSLRLVPILDGAQAALERLYTSAANTDDDAPVFATIERKTGRDGVVRPVGRALAPRMVTRVFRLYADRAGLPATIRLHDLRHTAITNAIAQGEDILLVSAFAGHAKTSTTVDIYGHLMPDRVRAAARRIHSVSNSGPVPAHAQTPPEEIGPQNARTHLPPAAPKPRAAAPKSRAAARVPYATELEPYATEPEPRAAALVPRAAARKLHAPERDPRIAMRQLHAAERAIDAMWLDREPAARDATITMIMPLAPLPQPDLMLRLDARRAA